MSTVENKHWGAIAHQPKSPQWASYLALRAYDNDAFSPRQRHTMAEYLTSSVDTYVHSLDRIQLGPEEPEVEFTMAVAAGNEEDAIENSLAAGLGALASIGVRLETVELLALHLANTAQLRADQGAVPFAMITDSHYDLTEAAYEVLPHELGFMADCQRLPGLAGA